MWLASALFSLFVNVVIVAILWRIAGPWIHRAMQSADRHERQRLRMGLPVKVRRRWFTKDPPDKGWPKP